MSGKVLILGATGRFGRHAAEAFWNAGWRVRVFDRSRDDLATAADGVDVIVNAWNPPYDRWETEVPRLTAAVIEAARPSGATVLIPGNVYVYGAKSGPNLSVASPHAATNALGRVRIAMEDAYRRSGVRTIVLRAGDYIDTEASGNWFDHVVTSKLSRGIVIRPGRADSVHAWAYLPDVARAAVALAEQRAYLEPFEDVGFPGYSLTFNEMTDLIARAIGRPVRQRAFPWWMLLPALPFWKMGRHLFEMRYLWSMPHRIEGARFAELVPGFRETSADAAIASAIGRHVNPDDAVAGGTLDLAA